MILPTQCLCAHVSRENRFLHFPQITLHISIEGITPKKYDLLGIIFLRMSHSLYHANHWRSS